MGYEEVAADPTHREGNAAGIAIDGVIYQLAGEPAPYPATVTGFTGNGQR